MARIATTHAASLIAACALIATLAGAPAKAASDGFWIAPAWPHAGGKGGGSAPKGVKHRRTVEVGKGDAYRFNTIAAGIKAAGFGGVVRVQPGIYIESLHITKPVTIFGVVNDKAPRTHLVKILAPTDEPCVDVDVPNSGFVQIRQMDLVAGKDNVQRSAVELEHGFLSVKDSSIAAPNYVSALLARGGQLSVEQSDITGGREGVLIAAKDSTGTFYLVDNTIAHNITGIKVDGIAQANIVGNRIWDNADTGISYYQGRGTIIGNDIRRNGKSQITIADGRQSPTVKFNVISEFFGHPISRVAPGPVGPWTPPSLPASKGAIEQNMIYGPARDCKAYFDPATASKNTCQRTDRKKGGWWSSKGRTD
jgi:hypothetical protein